MTTISEVIDKNGKRVTRNGPLQDGDRLSVPMRTMDASDQALRAAQLLAQNSRRNDQFDAKNFNYGGEGHRPGYATAPVNDCNYTARRNLADQARSNRIKTLENAWKKQTSTNDGGPQEQNAVRVMPSDQVHADGTAVNLQAVRAKADQIIEARDRRLEQMWKS